HQFSQHPELNQFNSQQHEQKIMSFAQQDKEHQLSASQEIIHRWNNIFIEQNHYKGQWTVLNKELGKKRRHIPVRELMRQIPDVLVGLKPCLLMSPLSVAQYLDTEAKFDVVIFDEASQIPVWDAIGALARGKQSIVVGDNKQMPPTSFFGKGDSEEEVDEEVTEDLESILDECLAAQLPELALNWHYRSRYESLIQFSNQKYYKGGLFTFPAPVAKDTAVKLHVVEGVYDKGDTRTNSNEAKAIVEFIIQHLQSQLGQENPLTLGVVTFNMTQQKLIEDLLDNELANHPELETLSKSGIEPLFVKNLENVQGDERDIIVFSITYAEDRDGRLSMNFGALNRQGGQRRLNVAITRARQGLHVFSALSPEEINLARTNSEGVRDLKDFLVFARSGQLHLNYADQSKQQAKKEFLQYLQTKLQEQGWSVDLGIGQGDSCVDIAIKDNLNSGSYLAGIIVDGENYAKAATARDRDQLRPTVLNGLGWQVLSVWTVDWWLDPEQNLAKLVKELDEIKINQQVA
ncbi:AAA domain-containing protein, partial [Acinetobacter tandoii]